FPFVRGREADRDVLRGWHVAADVAARTGAAANNEILTGLESGVTAVRLVVGAAGLPANEIPAALSGVLLELAPVALAAGPDTEAAAERLLAVLDAYRCEDRGAITASFGAAPLTAAFTHRQDIGMDAAVGLAGRAAARSESIRAITVDGTVFHNAGASDTEELGAAVAAGLEYLRALTASGLSVESALGQIEFRLAATVDQFQTIAKFRAARQLWARVAQVCGAPEAGAAPQHAVTSAAMLTRRDPWVNLLRETVAVFAAGVGGADSITVLPFDTALAPGALGVSSSFSARMARNIQLLLLEESHLGRVVDPAGGSWYAEDLTAGIAETAWAFVQDIERAGGYAAALESGLVHTRIAATRQAREADIAHRRTAVTGVNEFPDLTEKPAAAAPDGDVAHYASAFEALRDRSDAFLAAAGERPKALLVPLGTVAEHNVRVAFAANLLASGGIEAVNPGPLPADAVAAAAAESGATLAVLCGSDKRYGADAAQAVAALRGAGVARVLLAGPEKAVADVAGDARPDGFLTMRVDAVATLAELLDTLGA
ncbi:MAG: methylmalonyl-CoA mutase small subunit, partial [Mycobacteriaceae bacterium]|nr:methylmalonyl-CoA mutase small subunit [Mycobacteriaceae bacterium]